MSKHTSSKGNQASIQSELFNMDEGPTQDSFVRRTLNNAGREDLFVSLMAISSIKGIGFKTLQSMNASGFLLHFEDLNKDEIAREWSKLEIKPSMDYSEEIFENREKLLAKGKQEAEGLESQDVAFIPRGHESYPLCLLRLEHPPHWLFTKGNIDSLHSESIVGIVGTREPSDAGRNLAYRCADELTQRNFVVLSGLAKGIDESAHYGTIENFGQTIAIFGHGIIPRYGSLNKELTEMIIDFDGVLVSEYLPHDPPSRDRFLRRNELQAAFSKLIIPVEFGSLNSGTGATIRRASAIGTPVIGIIPQNTKEKELLKTRALLKELAIPVFEVLGDNSTEFWSYMKGFLPAHDWTINNIDRQDRFFRRIEKQILDSADAIALDDAAIDRFTTRIKENLEEEQHEKGDSHD